MNTTRHTIPLALVCLISAYMLLDLSDPLLGVASDVLMGRALSALLRQCGLALLRLVAALLLGGTPGRRGLSLGEKSCETRGRVR